MVSFGGALEVAGVEVGLGWILRGCVSDDDRAVGSCGLGVWVESDGGFGALEQCEGAGDSAGMGMSGVGGDRDGGPWNAERGSGKRWCGSEDGVGQGDGAFEEFFVGVRAWGCEFEGELLCRGLWVFGDEEGV